MPILNWLGRDEALKTANKTPYRLLEEVPELGYGDKTKENMIVQGDNLEALKALLPFYAGQVKCIYIDPPYNTGSAFEHYDDNLEHSQWLSLVHPRLELLRDFLSEDGCIFISIDDDEGHYLKIICDEVFGRKNYCGALVWEKKKKPSFLNANMGSVTEYILAYAKNRKCSPAFLGGYTTENKKYPINNAGNSVQILTFPEESVEFNCPDGIIYPQDMSEGNIITELLDKLEIVEGRNKNAFRLKGEWRYSQKKLNEIIANKEQIIISKVPFRPNHIKQGNEPKKMKNLLSIAHYNMATYEDATEESRCLFGGTKAFDYPKPEKLIWMLINAITEPDDLVLDSFLGSGTTAAVAHKMGRRYIGIEMGNHAITHCVPRLKAVVDGEKGGISKVVNWSGGGGFRFYKLGNEVFDAEGNINENISFENLSAHIWFTETKTPFNKPIAKSTYLGSYNNVSYALLYNGILRDKRVDGGNVLTNKTLNVILDDMKHQPYEKLVIYGESSRISTARLKSLNIEFKQTPYDIKAR